MYKPVSAISEKELKQIHEEYKIELNRCKQCYVIRTVRAHHCSKCKGCTMRMDHHCPWINNCVGQFNQKFFLLFCFYCLIGCCHAAMITGWYCIYKYKKEFLQSTPLVVFISIQLFFAAAFIIFNICMLWDQSKTISNDTTLVDMKKKKMLEQRSLTNVLNEVFGSSFSLHWFIPYRTGGYLPFFKKLHKQAYFVFFYY